MCWVLGMVGSGKSTTLNHIMSNSNKSVDWEYPFETGDDQDSVTKKIGAFVHEKVLYTDVPGFDDPSQMDSNTLFKLRKNFNLCHEMPAVLLVVVRFGRISERARQVLQFVFEEFKGDPSSIILVVTFTNADEKNPETAESYTQRVRDMEKGKLRHALLNKCKIAVMEQTPRDDHLWRSKPIMANRAQQLNRIQDLITVSKATARPKSKNFKEFLLIISRIIHRIACDVILNVAHAYNSSKALALYMKMCTEDTSKVLRDHDVKRIYGECCICFNNFDSGSRVEVVLKPCEHACCEECALRLSALENPKCHICRTDLRWCD